MAGSWEVAVAQSVQNCNSVGSLQAPLFFDGYGCGSICSVDSYFLGHKLECDLDNGSVAASGWVISNYGTSSRTFTAYGSDGNGDPFCCFFDDTSAILDFLSFHDETYGLDLEEDLSVGGFMKGGGGDDIFLASEVYDSDNLWGYEGNLGADNFTGNDDGEAFHGGYGEDVVFAGGGPDEIYGDQDPDELHGEGGDDLIKCGAGADVGFGGQGADEIYGENHADVLCSGGGTGDYLNGAFEGADESPIDYHDELWAPSTASAPIGDSQLNDACGDSDVWLFRFGTNCDYSLPTAPTECTE